MLEFRKSVMADTEAMAEIAAQGKALLKSKGISQWQRGTYPDLTIFQKDVEEGIGYVIADGDVIAAVCAITFTDEEDYRHLDTGSWLTGEDALYATIHRSAVALSHQGKNISGFLFAETAMLARERGAESIRIDTHPDNKTMQKTLLRAGFVKCGEFILGAGDEVGDLRWGYELKV